jgi:phosphoglycerate dehydrogenase-like enzyme
LEIYLAAVILAFLVTGLVPLHFLPDLQPAAGGLGVRLVGYDKTGNPVADPEGTEVLFRWWITPDQCDALIRACPLRWIHSGSAGIDHVLTQTFRESRIILTNSAGVHARPIAEWVVGAMLLLLKDFPRMLEQQRQHEWKKIESPELGGSRVVFLGAGHIAREIATRLRPFGVRLIAVRRQSTHDDHFDESFQVERLKEVVRDADWLLVTAPLTASTRGLVDSDILAAMPRHARVVNVARGEIVDIDALTSALAGGSLAGAILDVFSEEPLPPDDLLWSLPGVVILPHTTWRSPEVHGREAKLFLENLQRWCRGEPLTNTVDISTGY